MMNASATKALNNNAKMKATARLSIVSRTTCGCTAGSSATTFCPVASAAVELVAEFVSAMTIKIQKVLADGTDRCHPDMPKNNSIPSWNYRSPKEYMQRQPMGNPRIIHPHTPRWNTTL
jgi:hypothetical protein